MILGFTTARHAGCYICGWEWDREEPEVNLKDHLRIEHKRYLLSIEGLKTCKLYTGPRYVGDLDLIREGRKR